MKKLLNALFYCLLLITTGTALASAPSTIYIYSDQGVSQESLTQTIHTMSFLFGSKYSIQKIDARQVIQGTWRKDAALFIMPGGADLPYVKALAGQGNQEIKKYVEQGGEYLGICAGAYYGSREVQFAVGTPLEVIGPRELNFFPGIAKGPALAPYDYKSNSGSRAARILVSNGGLKEKAVVYFNGGPEFIADPNSQNFKIIARYEDLPENPPAIVEISVGSGAVILSGVHLEYDPVLLNPKDPYLPEIIAALKKYQTERIKILDSIFANLGPIH